MLLFVLLNTSLCFRLSSSESHRRGADLPLIQVQDCDGALHDHAHHLGA